MTICGVFSARHTFQIYATLSLRVEKKKLTKNLKHGFPSTIFLNCRDILKINARLFQALEGMWPDGKEGPPPPGPQAVLGPDFVGL